MSNLEERLRSNLSVIEFLNIIKLASTDLIYRGNYIIVTASILTEASRSTAETIQYCDEHGLIETIPLGKRSYEYHITNQGLSFIKAHSKVKY